ncbi:MAG: ribonuclease HI [Alphaproteobacteria bacterium]|nr:ribonuclease HI [Alphaproteobacteria bacterium]
MITIHCDGSCLGNPGAGGWAALLQYDRADNRKEKMISGGASFTTNNQMELTAALMALEAIIKPMPIAIYTDSEYLQKGITEWSKKWLVNGFRSSTRKPIKNMELWRNLLGHPLLPQVTWHWVRGHSGHPENERVDQLARATALEWQMKRT